MLTEFVQLAARRLLPKSWAFSERMRRYVESMSKGKVVSGPFAGMRYVTESTGSVFLPKILGTYELELTSDIEQAIAKGYERVIVVGAAEGYYAVGYLFRSAASTVFAFEATEQGRELMHQLATRNNVLDRLDIRGFCDVGALQAVLQNTGNPLVIVDIEGGEAFVLDPLRVPELSHSTIIVEVHEFAVPGMEKLIRERFSNTHNVRAVDARSRQRADFPMSLPTSLATRGDAAIAFCMNEARPAGMVWLVMTPA